MKRILVTVLIISIIIFMYPFFWLWTVLCNFVYGDEIDAKIHERYGHRFVGWYVCPVKMWEAISLINEDNRLATRIWISYIKMIIMFDELVCQEKKSFMMHYVLF